MEKEKKKKPTKITREQYENMTVDNLEYFLILEGNSKPMVGDKIRQLNRKWNAELAYLGCQCCGYNKHVELAHIKAIAEFSENSFIKEINDKDNILVLCRNCHWEFDNGILTIENIGIRR